MRRAQAVGASVAAADDDHAFARGGDQGRAAEIVAFAAPVLLRQVIHREVDAGQLTSRDGQIAWNGRPAAQNDRVELAAELVGGNALADVRVRPELDTFRLQDREPAIEDALLHLEFRDPVAKQTTDAIGPLEDGDPVSRLVQLIGSRETRGPGSDHGDALAAARLRRPG